MTDPLITVLMSVYNGDAYLQEAIDSILNQTYANFEFVIINDASTDQTSVILDKCTDSRVVQLHNKSNIGLTKSLNKGLAIAKGKYLARQDADDISLPDRLAQQVAFLDTFPEVAVVGSFYVHLYEDGRPEQTVEMPTTDDAIRQQLFYQHCFCHGSVMMRRSALEAVGGYNEQFKTAQDRDLWLRLAERYSLANLAQPLYKLRMHAASVTGSKRNQQRQAARQAVLNALTRGVLKPEPTALGRFYWQVALDELAVGNRAAAASYLQEALTANEELDEDGGYLLQTAVNRAFEAGPAQLSHKKSADDVADGMTLLNDLFAILPTEGQRLKQHHRAAIADRKSVV